MLVADASSAPVGSSATIQTVSADGDGRGSGDVGEWCNETTRFVL